MILFSPSTMPNHTMLSGDVAKSVGRLDSGERGSSFKDRASDPSEDSVDRDVRHNRIWKTVPEEINVPCRN